MAYKAIKVGYYWSSMQKDATIFAQRCDKCHRFANILKKLAEELVPMARSWPFA